MNLDNLVKFGRAPWAPAPETTDLDVWHLDDVPTVGTFRFGSCTVLFSAVGDVEGRMTVWGYSCLEPSEAETLGASQYANAVEMQSDVERMFVGHRVVFALARDNEVFRWSPIDNESGLYPAAAEFLEAVVKSLDSPATPSRRFEARRAEAAILVG